MNRQPTEHPAPTTLCPEDAAALEALLLGTADPSPRADRVAGLLALLDRYPAQDPSGTLRARLLEQVQALRNAADHPATIADADARALDALLALNAQGAQQGPMPPGSAQRAQAVAGLLGLLSHFGHAAAGETPPADLAERTMQRVQQDRQRQTLARIGHEARPGDASGWSVGLRQVGSVAAVLVIGLSLLVPVLSHARHQAQQADCRDNLAKAGGGLTQYANDNRGTLPLAAQPEDVFSELMRFAEDADGQSLPSSSVHMLVLPREGYLRQEQLTCPSGTPELVMGGLYSAQHVEGSRALKLDTMHGPLMADTNPLYTLHNGRAVRQPGWDASASKNHGGRGQNVLMADTSIRWTIVPVVRHDDRDDNIWAEDPAPAGEDAEPKTYDAFLTP